VIEVERATEADLARLTELSEVSLRDPWSRNALAQELRLPEARLLVGRTGDGEVVGYVAVRRIVDELHVLSLAVDPGWRRLGVGKKLPGHAIEAESGVRRVHLEARAEDPTAAAFYRALGFVSVARRPAYYPGSQDALSMTRPA